MKLTTLEIKDYHKDAHGINPGQYDRLPNLICLVGRNGAGKSRILKIFKNEILYNPLLLGLKEQLDFTPLTFNVSQELRSFANVIQDAAGDVYKISLLNDKQQLNQVFRSKFNKRIVNRNISILDEYIGADNIWKTVTEKLLKEVNYSKLKELNQKRNPQVKFVKPEAKDMRAPTPQTQPTPILNPIIDLLKNTSASDELDSIYNYGLQYLDDLVKMLAFEKITHFQTPEKLTSTDLYKTFESLRSLVNQVLGKEIIYEVDTSKIQIEDAGNSIGGIGGSLILQNRKFNFSDLSDGEKVLFSFAFLLFIHEQNSNIQIKDSILIIDEPETHLHPELQVLLIKRLKKIIDGTGQLIIATHSIHIISSLEAEQIFLVENNTLYPPSSKNISKTIDALIGFGDEYEKFKDFCFHEYDWGFRNFIAQCFIEPAVIQSAKQNDPQIELFKKAISNKQDVKILDCGAGAGRLGKEIQSEINSGKIEYSCFDINPHFNKDLKLVGAKNIWNKMNELPTDYFDFAVVCNVLHEINFFEIEEELNTILRSLKQDGFLIIIEDKILSKGESPNDIGYLVFTEPEIKVLLNIKKEVPTIIHPDVKYTDRIMCAVIPRENADFVNSLTLLSAAKLLRENSFVKYKDIKNKTFKSKAEQGRISAFYAQQYINASIAAEKII